jgi:imidazole glycerol-phosphate synthase subunit HisH
MIAVIDYGAGNTFNVLHALQELQVQAILTHNEADILKADKVIFPGVGHAQQAMQALQDRNLQTIIQQLQQPVLGICLGMQLLAASSTEGNTTTLGIIETIVERFNTKVPVPHMGWNNIEASATHPLFANGIHNADYYFVHSYYMPKNKATIATCAYEINFTAAVQHNNFYGTQFHPEKSGTAGLQLLKNFLALA